MFICGWQRITTFTTNLIRLMFTICLRETRRGVWTTSFCRLRVILFSLRRGVFILFEAWLTKKNIKVTDGIFVWSCSHSKPFKFCFILFGQMPNSWRFFFAKKFTGTYVEKFNFIPFFLRVCTMYAMCVCTYVFDCYIRLKQS